jgi:hypothetical protein
VSNPLFGRKWRISIFSQPDADGNSRQIVLSDSTKEQTTGALRVTFEIDKPGWSTPNYSDITIWNLKAKDFNIPFYQGQRVLVEAGYVTGAFGVIFDGQLFQPIWDRPDVVDYTLMLHCIDGMDKLDQNLINRTIGVGSTYESQVHFIAKNAQTPIPIQYITPNLKMETLPRGKSFFGDAKGHLDNIAKANNAQWWLEDGKLTLSQLTDISKEKALVYSPATGLIGTPQQTQAGVLFKVSLDPRIKIRRPGLQIKLDNVLVRKMLISQGQIASPLDRDFYCMVARVRHIGDTRGGEGAPWYTEVLGISGIGPIQMLEGTQESPQEPFLPEIYKNPKTQTGN